MNQGRHEAEKHHSSNKQETEKAYHDGFAKGKKQGFKEGQEAAHSESKAHSSHADVESNLKLISKVLAFVALEERTNSFRPPLRLDQYLTAEETTAFYEISFLLKNPGPSENGFNLVEMSEHLYSVLSNFNTHNKCLIPDTHLSFGKMMDTINGLEKSMAKVYF